MISIFAKPSYLGNLYPKHTDRTNTHRLSSRIRGEEMSTYGGFKLNPKRGYENDTCIWVKPTGFGHIKDGDWVDVLDGLRKDRHKMLKDRPGINIIAVSENSRDVLKAELPNKIVLIPHHHLNIEKIKRTKKKIDTCGYIGSPSPIAFKIYEELGERMKEIGMKWVTCFDYKTREDAVNLYKKIDILVIGVWDDKNPHKIPTKIINAASFGIPSVAFPLAGYKEIEGYYIRAANLHEFQKGVEKLKDQDYYDEWSFKVSKMAEKYHVKEVVKLYKKLK